MADGRTVWFYSVRIKIDSGNSVILRYLSDAPPFHSFWAFLAGRFFLAVIKVESNTLQYACPSCLQHTAPMNSLMGVKYLQESQESQIPAHGYAAGSL